MGTGLLLMMLLIIGGFSHAASIWTVRTQPARLVNGSPVLFQVKPPAKLEALTGTWLGHQIIFSYNSSTKTWFALAGLGAYLGFRTSLGRGTETSLAAYNDLVKLPPRAANVTITLP